MPIAEDDLSVEHSGTDALPEKPNRETDKADLSGTNVLPVCLNQKAAR